MIMATAAAAVVGLSAKRLPPLLGSTAYYSDLPDKLACSADPTTATNTSSIITAKKSSPNFVRRPHSVKAHADHCATLESWLINGSTLSTSDPEYLVDAVLLLHKSMLEKQWNLAPKTDKKIEVTCSGTSARRRRIDSRRKVVRSIISPQLVHNTLKGYVKGVVSEQLLTHAEVVQLSHKIKAGLALEDRRSRYSNLSLSL